MIKSMENILGSNVTTLIMKVVSLLVNNGISVNTGHNNDLWNICQEYILEKFSELVAPLLAIWCCEIKPSLAWKSANNEIPEIKNILMLLSGISLYFAKYRFMCRFKNTLLISKNI